MADPFLVRAWVMGYRYARAEMGMDEQEPGNLHHLAAHRCDQDSSSPSLDMPWRASSDETCS